MKDEKSRMLKIMNELARFYLKAGSKHVQIALDLSHEEGVITLEGCSTKLSDQQLSDLNDIFNSPRKDESEEYYWNLVGSNDFSELHLLGSLVNDGRAYYEENLLKVRVRRKF